jgi:LysR family transcriptional regulator for metE and metH
MINERFEFKHLLAIKAICDESSLTKAAESLFMSQPALSRRISKLEHELGVDLFDRLGKKMIPTPAAKTLIDLAKHILPKLKQTQQQLQIIKQGHEPSIRIATACFTCYHWLPDVISLLDNGAQLDIVSEATQNPNQALLDGVIDVAIANEPCKHPGVYSSQLNADQYLAVVAKAHHLADLPYLTPEDCQPEHLILYDNHSQAFDLFLKPNKVIPKKLSTVPLTGAILQMVKANLGITFQSQWVLAGRNLAADYKTLKLGKNGTQRIWYISYLKSNHGSQYKQLAAAINSTMTNL